MGDRKKNRRDGKKKNPEPAHRGQQWEPSAPPPPVVEHAEPQTPPPPPVTTSPEVRVLGIPEMLDIAERYMRRSAIFPDESERDTLMVVLANYGEHLVRVQCVRHEWSGTKGDIPPGNGIPRCPNGHVLVEYGPRYRLALVERLM